MSILHAEDKSPVRRGFFTSSTGGLLPAVGFLSRLHNFCNYIFSKSQWYVEVVTYFTDLEMLEYYQKMCD